MTHNPRSILVVGAGIAGLVAARTLARAGHAVRVIEAGEVVGGRVGQREVRGIRFNSGARLLYSFSKPFNRLLDELDLTRTLIPIKGLSAQCQDLYGSWLVELMPGPRSLLTPGLTVADRVRFVSYGLLMAALRRRTDPDDITSVLDYDGETLADHVTRHLGPRVLKRMVDPIFRGTRSWNAEEISATFFASTTPHLLGRDTVHIFSGGMDMLPIALASGLKVTCNTRAISIEAPPEGPCRVHAVSEGQETIYETDLVVSGIEGSHVRNLVLGLDAEDRAFFDGVRYNSLGIVHYRMKQDIPGAMQFFTRRASGTVATYQQVPSNSAKGVPPQIYAQLTPEAAQKAKENGMTEALDRIVADDVRRLYPALDSDCADLHNQWIERKLPVFYCGYGASIRRFLTRRAGARHRLYFCGDYLAQALVTGAAASGTATARQIAADWD